MTDTERDRETLILHAVMIEGVANGMTKASAVTGPGKMYLRHAQERLAVAANELREKANLLK